MADLVSSVEAWRSAGKGEYVYRFTNQSDGTGESGVVKIDVSALLNDRGEAGSQAVIKRIEWSVLGFNYVSLDWDHTADVNIATLAGSGIMFFDWFGGFASPGTGGTGDVILTTDGAIDGACYDMTIFFEIK